MLQEILNNINPPPAERRVCPHSSSAVCSKFDSNVGSPVRCLAFFLPPLRTSLPRAFCSSATGEDGMTARAAPHAVSVWEFLRGNAPTRRRTHSNTHGDTHSFSNTHVALVDGGKLERLRFSIYKMTACSALARVLDSKGPNSLKRWNSGMVPLMRRV